MAAVELDFFRQKFWGQICDAVIEFSKHISVHHTAHAPFQTRNFAVPGAVRTLLLKVGHHISPNDLLQSF